MYKVITFRITFSPFKNVDYWDSKPFKELVNQF